MERADIEGLAHREVAILPPVHNLGLLRATFAFRLTPFDRTIKTEKQLHQNLGAPVDLLLMKLITNYNQNHHFDNRINHKVTSHYSVYTITLKI